MKQIFSFFLVCWLYLPMQAQESVALAMDWVSESSNVALDLTPAIRAYQSNDIKLTEKILDQYKKNYPNHPDVLLFEGKILMDKKKHDKASEKLQKVLLLDPNNAQAFYYQGLNKDLQGDHINAIVDFTQAVTIDPTYALPYEARATSKSTAGDQYSAIEDFTKAIELNPNLKFAYEGRGLAYYKTEQYEQAVRDFKHVIKNNRNRQSAVYYMGMSKVKMGDQSGCRDLRRAYTMGMQGAAADIKRFCMN